MRLVVVSDYTRKSIADTAGVRLAILGFAYNVGEAYLSCVSYSHKGKQSMRI